MIKHAWIDEERKIVSFHRMAGSHRYTDEEASFWRHIMNLVDRGFLLQ